MQKLKSYISALIEATDTVLNIYSGRFGQSLSLPCPGVGMVMTVPYDESSSESLGLAKVGI